MKKLLLLLILPALALAACGGGAGAGAGEIAATVDSTSEITTGDVEGLLAPADGAKVSKEQFSDFLDFKVKWVIIENAAADQFDITFTEEEIAAEADQIVETNITDGTTREEFLATNEVTEEFLQNVAHQQLITVDVRVALEPDVESPAQEDVDAQLENAILGVTEVCAKHILVASEVEANDVLARLEAGEAFEDLAIELSLDTGSGAEGGDLGCAPASRYVPEFAAATLSVEIDVPTDPVETEFGFHIILVSSRTEPAAEDIPSEQTIIESLNQTAVDQALAAWFPDAFAVAMVVVNEKYGTWQTDPVAGVIPPVE